MLRFNSERVQPLGLVLALIACCAGCTATHAARLTGPAPVGVATLVLSVDRHRSGTLGGTLQNGERCSGTFNTVPAEVDWDPEEGTTENLEVSQVGMLLMTCPRGRVVRCDFSRSFWGPGSGECLDGAGNEFALQLF